MRRTDQRRAAVFICYQRDVTGATVEELVQRPPPATEPGNGSEPAPPKPGKLTPYTVELVEGVESTRDELDDVLEQNAIGWRVERIAPLERAILRVALHEIMHRPDVPDEVAIDEAVETTKLYCGSEAPAFVNGILGGAVRNASHG